MKTRLLIALVSLLLAGCGSNGTLNLTPSATAISEGETSTISAALLTPANVAPNIQQKVELESDDDAAVFPGGRKASFNTTAGAGSATVTAAKVDRNTTVTISGNWVIDYGWDPTDDTTVEVRPPKVESPKNGQSYILVAPSVTPSWTYVYEITSRDTGGGNPVGIKGCTLQFNVPVTVTVIEATNATIGAITVTPNNNGNNQWYLSGGPTFVTLKIQVVAADASPDGTATVTCHGEDSHNYVTTVTGPKP
jgi:predicted small lipoprotein YifL